MRLELSSEGRYALRTLVYLAWIGERATAEKISIEAHIPRRLLARVLAKLSRAGLVESEQGRDRLEVICGGRIGRVRAAELDRAGALVTGPEALASAR